MDWKLDPTIHQSGANRFMRITDDQGQTVTLVNANHPDAIRNAHLLAAAPDLRDACQAARQYWAVRPVSKGSEEAELGRQLRQALLDAEPATAPEPDPTADDELAKFFGPARIPAEHATQPQPAAEPPAAPTAPAPGKIRSGTVNITEIRVNPLSRNRAVVEFWNGSACEFASIYTPKEAAAMLQGAGQWNEAHFRVKKVWSVRYVAEYEEAFYAGKPVKHIMKVRKP
jgi:hypothetical protein